MYQNLDLKSRWEKLAKWGREYQSIIFAALILLMIFFIGLGLGLLIRPIKPTPIIVDKNVKIGLPERQAEFSEDYGKSFNFANGNFVASINGKNYYPKDCASAKRIKEENMIWFNSAEEAEADGYALAKNCP
ncbi:MAG: hypothetical protein UT16_C0001G0030 [Candidatus Azambacteria bacterium GW2011_GWA2_39_10]|uniref:Uncharacterized protein n=1 Tax=Candidatus Azambacteria bacterium GW2011_GWA2_39_10 TaxID=1618611 RepID=A0A0G0P499_9BACT|nr:MAG: hypothetical protein UT16_C0001G0030 [Candidatus Azambacteria bacterium GW2011_GWA2_39_10]